MHTKFPLSSGDGTMETEYYVPPGFLRKKRGRTCPSGLERARGNTDTLKHFSLFFCQINNH